MELALLAPQSLGLLQSLGDSDPDGKDGVILVLLIDVAETAGQHKCFRQPSDLLCGAAL